MGITHEQVADQIVIRMLEHFKSQTWLDDFDGGLPKGHLRDTVFSGVAPLILSRSIQSALEQAYEDGQTAAMCQNCS